MNNFITLVKIQLLEILTLNKKKKKDIKKAMTLTGAVTALLVLTLLLSFTYNYLIFDSFKQNNNIELYLPLVFVLTSFIITITGLIKIKSVLFGNKDYNLLESMPIGHKTIIASKIFVVYIYEFIFSFSFFVPAIIISSVYEFELLKLLFSIGALFFLPLVPLLIGAIIGLPLAFIFDKTKYGSIISLVFYVIYIVLLMYFIYGKSTPEAKGLMYNNMVINFNKFYFISKFYTLGLGNDYLYVALFFTVNILTLVLFIFMASFFYKPINVNLMSMNIKTEYKSKELKNSSQKKALLSREFKRITASPSVFLNSMIGGIMSIIMVVIMYTSFKSAENFDDIKDYVFPFMIVMISFGLGMAPVSATNISLEGNSFWILKSAPIDENLIIKYKILISIILLFPFSLAASIVAIILFKANIIGSIACILLPLVYIVLISYLGMITQLKHPKLHFQNEMEVLKHSSSSYITLFIGIGIDIALAFAIIMGLVIHIVVGYVLAFIMLIGFSITCYAYLKMKGKYLFNRIE